MSTAEQEQRPPAQGEDEAWSEKVERAKEIREAAQKVREGKPLAFPTHRVRP
jgi:hypothetical protein